jgi:GTP-binding protein EngB required for normal cell division
VDARHPGLENDREAWAWLQRMAGRAAVVATKIDKLARGERIRAMGQLESVFEDSVLPVSAATGEGLDELWKLIDKLVNSPRRNSPSRAEAQPRRQPPTRPRGEMPGTAATAPRKR